MKYYDDEKQSVDDIDDNVPISEILEMRKKKNYIQKMKQKKKQRQAKKLKKLVPSLKISSKSPSKKKKAMKK